MNKVSFDQSSKLSLKRDPDSRHEPNPSYYWNSSRKKTNCTFLQILFLLFFWLKPHYTKTTGSQNNTTHLQVFKEKLSENDIISCVTSALKDGGCKPLRVCKTALLSLTIPCEDPIWDTNYLLVHSRIEGPALSTVYLKAWATKNILR